MHLWIKTSFFGGQKSAYMCQVGRIVSRLPNGKQHRQDSPPDSGGSCRPKYEKQNWVTEAPVCASHT